MKKIFSIETSSEAEWAAVLKIIQESFDDKYFTEFEISIPYRIYNSNAFNEWLEELMRVCRVNNSYRFWRFDEHIATCDTSYRRIIFRKVVNDEMEIVKEQRNNYARRVEELEESIKSYEYCVVPGLEEKCKNQAREINLLLKQKDKLEKKLEEYKNHQVDMLAYRDDVIGKISREKNKLENANKSQLRYIEEMEGNMKKGNEQYKKLRDDYDVLEEKFNKVFKNYEILEEKYEKRCAQNIKYHSVHEFEQLKKAEAHEMFDMLLTAKFLKKQEEKKEDH